MRDYSDNEQRLLRLKPLIKPKDISHEQIIAEIINKYTCKNITKSFIQNTKFIFFMENYFAKYNEKLEINNVSAFEILNSDLEPNDPDSNVYFVIESKHCFFETNCNELFDEISWIKSVSPYDYENETDELFDLLSRFDQADE